MYTAAGESMMKKTSWKQLKHSLQSLKRGLDSGNVKNDHALRDFTVEWAQCGGACKAVESKKWGRHHL